MKKYKVQLEKFKKYHFYGKNRLFWQFLESSGFKNQFYWQLNHAWWWVLLLIKFLCEKTAKYKKKVQWKSAKTAISGIFPAFSAGKKFFSKIGLGHILGIINTHLCLPSNTKYAWVTLEEKEIALLNDFRWSSECIDWKDFLLLLEGDIVNLPRPKNNYTV